MIIVELRGWTQTSIWFTQSKVGLDYNMKIREWYLDGDKITTMTKTTKLTFQEVLQIRAAAMYLSE